MAKLVVDDYEPFRRFVCSKLGKRPELQIVCEAPDRLEAVHKTEELQPDSILLDVGLPSLNGIEAARRIRKLSPESRIRFVSQDSSVRVVRGALAEGAKGNVVKTDVGTRATRLWMSFFGANSLSVRDFLVMISLELRRRPPKGSKPRAWDAALVAAAESQGKSSITAHSLDIGALLSREDTWR
jgi:DNA-binding NarL/FixJ family response regulator